jgi:hypothetical protein
MTFKNLTLWTRPKNYAGPSYPDMYVVYSQNRDSDMITRFNFESLESILEHDHGIQFLNVRDHHWACGWIEFLYVHKDSDKKSLKKLDENLGKLEDYPILDDLEYSEWMMEELGEQYDDNKDSFFKDALKFLRIEEEELTKREKELLETLIYQAFVFIEVKANGEDETYFYAEKFYDYIEKLEREGSLEEKEIEILKNLYRRNHV